MPIDLYVVHGSHPCAAVQRALELKGLRFRVIELPPPLHAPIQRVRFGARTVPAVVLEDADDLRRRIDEAARHVPGERLAVSTQCGFASDASGNLISEARQEEKPQLVAETAYEIWA